MTGKTKLRFEEKKPPSKLMHRAADTPIEIFSARIHQKIRENEDENVGVEAAEGMEESAEAGGRVLRRSRASHNRKNRAKNGNEGKAASNPQSKRKQKQNIKKQYVEARRAASKGGVAAAQNAEKATRTVKDTAKKAIDALRSNNNALLMLGALALLLVFLLSTVSSCSVFLSGLGSSISATTYPVSDDDLLGAEAAYCAMEAELQAYLDTYEQTHDYNSYRYDLDSIGHDPYVLLSAITALRGGAWTLDEIGDTLQLLFDKQYILTEDVTTETRYRTETRTGTRTVTDPETGESSEEEYEYDVQVPYTYTICNVTLDNFNLSHVPVYIMSQEQLGMYARYMSGLGNRSDLFPDSEYIPKYITGSYTDYEIPPEALEDENFAAMIEEAEKYLGYPYVWGGSNPTTSFDCSGFVSWVINQSGWDVGRLGAQGLCDICTPVTDPRPGDLVFFTGTYDAGVPVSHVGLYVGDGWMIHAGDPISYCNIGASYYQQHFYRYGRLSPP